MDDVQRGSHVMAIRQDHKVFNVQNSGYVVGPFEIATEQVEPPALVAGKHGLGDGVDLLGA